MGGASEFVTSREAVALLGVKTKTLYAYASRGWIRTQRTARTVRYSREDLVRLKARRDARAGHGAVAAGALQWGEAVLDTSVSTLDPRGPIYRGHLATDLAAAGMPFESVAELLWTSSLPAEPPAWASCPLPPLPSLATLPSPPSPMRAMLLLLPWSLHAATHATELDLARALLLTLATLPSARMGNARTPSATVAATLLLGFCVPPEPTLCTILDRCLILCADHELNPSTFAARLAASAGADMVSSVTAALATLSGPRHGGVTERVEAMLDGLPSPDAGGAHVRDLAARGEAPPGFGHPLYAQGDPRARAMLALAEAHAPDAPRVRVLVEMARAAEASGLARATLDVGLVAVAEAVGLPRGGAAGIFAVGRAAGWVAHILEQRGREGVLRPRARYVGAR